MSGFTVLSLLQGDLRPLHPQLWKGNPKIKRRSQPLRQE